MTATVRSELIPVRHTIRSDVDREFIVIDCPNGWEDVKKICKKVLEFEGRLFTFTGWNSDRNDCTFVRPLLNGMPSADVKTNVAKIKR